MNNKIIGLCCCLALAACSDSDKNKSAQPVSYVPDPAQVYQKVVTDLPAGVSIFPQETEPCYVDVVNQQIATGVNVLADKMKVQMSGWSGDVPNGKSPEELWLKLDGIKQSTGPFYIKAMHGLKRPDVADFFKKTGLADTGWETFADLSEVAGGTYEVHVVMRIDQHWMMCDTKRVIQI